MTADARPIGFGGAPARVTVLATCRFDTWALPPFHTCDERVWIHGGERTLIELAAAAASAGFSVELRGEFIEREVAAVEQAAGVCLLRPSEPRRPLASDTVIVPEGMVDPRLFAIAAFSPARTVVMVMAAPGLFGWPFDRDGPLTDAREADPSTVGRPEQLEAARSLGLELWTNLRAISVHASSIPVLHHYLGVGRPVPYPEPSEKRVDVVTLADNRWAHLAREAVAHLPPDVTRTELPAMPRDRLLRELGAARILVHPARIEGRSRLGEEARAMGTVPILLASNHFADGTDASSGGVAVNAVAEVAPAVRALLADRSRLLELAQAGYREARKEGDWQAFVERVAVALAKPDGEVRRFAPGRAALGAKIAGGEQALLGELSLAHAREQELSAALELSEQRYQSLRRRKAVRSALRLADLRGRLNVVRRRT